MKRYLYMLLVIAMLALPACTTDAAPADQPSGDGSGELIPPRQSDGAVDSSIQGAAGAAVSEAGTVPALCSGASDADTAAFAAEVARLVNVERAKVSLPALTSNSKLNQAAQTHAIDMGCNFFLSHTGSDGSTPDQRMLRFDYQYSWWGENVAAGQTTPAAVMTAWMNSQSHRDNILSANFTNIGIGYVYNSRDTKKKYYHYWAMSLGRPQ